MSQAKVLAGKRVLVTGGAQRIGRTIALTLARHGAEVAITYLQSEGPAKSLLREIKNLGVEGLAVKCDVRDPKSVRAAASKILGKFGRLDILINNAALYETAVLQQITAGQWDRIFQTNARGPFLMAQAFLPTLREQSGRIINLSSLGAARPWSSHAHYCVSKAALNMLTQVMAKAFAPEVAVNAVAPGLIETGRGSSQELQRVAAKTPMRRIGAPDDVAEAVLFFTTATRFITGQILYVDGGLGLAT